MGKYAFKFISGKYQGGEYPLADHAELIIGRAVEADIVLVEEMVSRRHAKLVVNLAQLTLTDLDSTNGTFVNGEKIGSCTLQLDDRLLIGTSILKLIAAADTNITFEPEDKDALRGMLQALGARGSNTSQTMSGDLAEVPLPDLLQLFATNRKTGTLRLSCTHTPYGEVMLYIEQGALQHLEASQLARLPPLKVLCRLLMLSASTFEFTTGALPAALPRSLTQSTENLLIEAMRLNDETLRARKSLPRCDNGFQLSLPLNTRLADLNAAQLDTLQLALNTGSVDALLDNTPGADVEALQHLELLLRTNYLKINP